MKKINLKVALIYGIYKQVLYILLFIATIVLSFIFKEYANIIRLISLFFVFRVVYGILYYRLILIEIWEDRLSLREGVFTYSKNFVELYRVKDYSEYQSLFMRIFGVMNITLHTSDKTSPVLKLNGVPKSNIVDVIRVAVERQRKLKGVREFD